MELKSTYWTAEKEQFIISRACRGLILKSPKELSKLHCRMLSRSAFTKIAPFKIEEANLDPLIWVFHEILSDTDINVFKSLGNSNLKRAEILTVNSTSEVSQKRVAKLNFFDDSKNKRLPVLTKRVAEMSGLNMKTTGNLFLGIDMFEKTHEILISEQNLGRYKIMVLEGITRRWVISI